MGSEEHRDRLEEERQQRADELKTAFSKLIDDNPDLPIQVIIGIEERSGLTICGVESFCLPCFTSMLVRYVMNTMSMHNLLGHEDAKQIHDLHELDVNKASKN